MAVDHQNSASISTGPDADHNGRLRIIAAQVGQDPGQYTSQVRVQGIMENLNDRRVDNLSAGATERHIEGHDSYYPSDFHFNISANGQLIYIERTFTVLHDLDGTQHVNYTVHYGISSTPTFDHDKQVSVGLDLDPFSPAGGAWIRVNGKWVHSIPYVRYKGDWLRAKPYVRTGGVWKPVQ
jgi:hypothetical protein